MNRSCMDCGTAITACNGFVLARDWSAAVRGVIPWTSVRERCGKCVLRNDNIRQICEWFEPVPGRKAG